MTTRNRRSRNLAILNKFFIFRQDKASLLSTKLKWYWAYLNHGNLLAEEGPFTSKVVAENMAIDYFYRHKSI